MLMSSLQRRKLLRVNITIPKDVSMEFIRAFATIVASMCGETEMMLDHPHPHPRRLVMEMETGKTWLETIESEKVDNERLVMEVFENMAKVPIEVKAPLAISKDIARSIVEEFADLYQQ